MRPRLIQIATSRILRLFIQFHASAVSHFSFFGRFAPPVSTMRTLRPMLPADAVQPEEAKASHPSGDHSFRLGLRVSVKVSLTVT
jgi:hypothetical protein